MAAVVTFDPINLYITEVNTGLDVNNTDLVEIYSEWKDWLLADPTRMGYPRAFRQVGGDPITGTQNLGTTFFLNVGAGWRLKPAEYDHQWIITGNIFTDPENLRRTVPTDGDYTVEVTYFVSNLVDSSVARLDLNQLLQGIYFDAVNGSPGTGDDNGTPTNPTNNNADLWTLLAQRNLSQVFINGTFTLDQDAQGYSFQGLGNHLSNNFVLGGYNVNASLFIGLNLEGTMQGRIEARDCGLNVLAGVDGVFTDCGLVNDFSMSASSNGIFRNCYSEIVGTDTVELTMAANSMVQFRNYSGGLELRNFAATNLGSFDMDPGHLILNADCTGGSLVLRGMGSMTRNDANVVAVTDAGMNYGGQLVLGRDADYPDGWTQQLP